MHSGRRKPIFLCTETKKLSAYVLSSILERAHLETITSRLNYVRRLFPLLTVQSTRLSGLDYLIL